MNGALAPSLSKRHNSDNRAEILDLQDRLNSSEGRMAAALLGSPAEAVALAEEREGIRQKLSLLLASALIVS